VVKNKVTSLHDRPRVIG